MKAIRPRTPRESSLIIETVVKKYNGKKSRLKMPADREELDSFLSLLSVQYQISKQTILNIVNN